MKLNKIIMFLTALPALIITVSSAEENSNQGAGVWKRQLNLNYVSGFSDLVDAYELEGFTSDFEIPVGVSFSFGKEYRNGLGWDVSLGPAILILGDVNSTIVPVGTGFKYSFKPDQKANPYLRVGAQYAFVSGDFLEDSELGYSATVGLEFNGEGRRSWGLEVKYDSTAIDFNGSRNRQEIKPYDLVIGVFFAF